MKNKNVVQDQFDQIIAKNVKEEYVYDLDLLQFYSWHHILALFEIFQQQAFLIYWLL